MCCLFTKTVCVSVCVVEDNDCAPESNPCPINAKCVNTRDGFYCNCSEGYRNVDSVSCEGEANKGRKFNYDR